MRPTRQPCRQATASPANEPNALPSPWAAPGACSKSRAQSPETHHPAPAAAGHGPGPFDRTADEARLEWSGTRFGSQPQRMQRTGSWSAPVQDRLVPVDAESHSSRNQTVGVSTDDLYGGSAHLFLDSRSLRRNCEPRVVQASQCGDLVTIGVVRKAVGAIPTNARRRDDGRDLVADEPAQVHAVGQHECADSTRRCHECPHQLIAQTLNGSLRGRVGVSDSCAQRATQPLLKFVTGN